MIALLGDAVVSVAKVEKELMAKYETCYISFYYSRFLFSLIVSQFHHQESNSVLVESFSLDEVH